MPAKLSMGMSFAEIKQVTYCVNQCAHGYSDTALLIQVKVWMNYDLG